MMEQLNKKIAFSSVFVALGLILSYVEAIIPLNLFIPIPGFKLGLSNIAVTCAFLLLGARYAFPVLIGKICLSSLLFGTVTSFYFSLFGGLISFIPIMLYNLVLDKYLGIIGISVFSAAMHNLGQCLAASTLFGSSVMVFYLPPLLFVSLVTGTVTALVIYLTYTRLSPIYKNLISGNS